MQKFRIVWIDDEIDLLKPHLILLQAKGYDTEPVNNAADALVLLEKRNFDLVFLDENMPGIGGLEALVMIKDRFPNLPVVMVTKNEQEHIMEQAIGAKISDYLIKPVHPNQILLTVKKLLDNQRIISERTLIDYQQEFSKISLAVMDANTWDDWQTIYRRLVKWDIQFDQSADKAMREILESQRKEAQNGFCKFITKNYEKWLTGATDAPTLSHTVLKNEVFPSLNENQSLLLIVIDNLRLDQWEVLETEVLNWFDVFKKEYFSAILPTATAYARNALFAGMLPSEIQKKHPDLWSGEDEDSPKNAFESQLLGINLKRAGINLKYNYFKVISDKDGKNLVDQFDTLVQHPLTAIVYNFVDMLSHARTDMQVIRELARDESAYRRLTSTWFMHSSLLEVIKKAAKKRVKVIITTDHGTIRVSKPEKIIGDKSLNTNLRYKQGKNIAFDERKVFHTRNPESFFLPKYALSTSYLFAKEDEYFVYQNNYNQYVNLYADTFQHGGISMEEMILPIIHLHPK